MFQHDDVIPDSTYPALEAPGEFKSQIPEHLLKDASPTDRYMLEQMSILRQHNEWSTQAHLTQDRNQRLTNGRLRRAEVDIKDLKADRTKVKTSWWAISKLVAGVVGFVSFVWAVYKALHGG